MGSTFQYSVQNGCELTEEELDDQMRKMFVDIVNRASDTAKRKGDAKQLKEIAHLLATCIDWPAAEEDEEDDKNPVGFRRRKKDE